MIVNDFRKLRSFSSFHREKKEMKESWENRMGRDPILKNRILAERKEGERAEENRRRAWRRREAGADWTRR